MNWFQSLLDWELWYNSKYQFGVKLLNFSSLKARFTVPKIIFYKIFYLVKVTFSRIKLKIIFINQLFAKTFVKFYQKFHFIFIKIFPSWGWENLYNIEIKCFYWLTLFLCRVWLLFIIEAFRIKKKRNSLPLCMQPPPILNYCSIKQR